MFFLSYVSAFLMAFPVVMILALAGMRAAGGRRRAHRAWGLRPGREVLRRRGRWLWRTAA